MINELKHYKISRVFGLFVLLLLVWMLYGNYTGCRIFRHKQGSSWSAGGPGGHK